MKGRGPAQEFPYWIRSTPVFYTSHRTRTKVFIRARRPARRPTRRCRFRTAFVLQPVRTHSLDEHQGGSVNHPSLKERLRLWLTSLSDPYGENYVAEQVQDPPSDASSVRRSGSLGSRQAQGCVRNGPRHTAGPQHWRGEFLMSRGQPQSNRKVFNTCLFLFWTRSTSL